VTFHGVGVNCLPIILAFSKSVTHFALIYQGFMVSMIQNIEYHFSTNPHFISLNYTNNLAFRISVGSVLGGWYFQLLTP